jgi:aryl-alcohol dehydrogenase-like predicted oxidoreductase
MILHSSMTHAKLGKTELTVSRLGIGMAELGYGQAAFRDKSEVVRSAGEVLNLALDLGINFIDTAACCGQAEELIGGAIGDRRDEFVLATKAGHRDEGAPGEDFSYETVTANIDRSLKRMKADYIDILHLHTCTLEELQRGEAIQALQDARQAGKIRFLGFSGDAEEALWVIESGLFDTLLTSYNLVDQQALRQVIPAATAAGMGVTLKRSLANGVWGAPTSPLIYPHKPWYANEYHDRASQMRAAGPLPGEPDDPFFFALGFALAPEEVHVANVSMPEPQHVRKNVENLQSLPLPAALVAAARQRFEEVGSGWKQLH